MTKEEEQIEGRMADLKRWHEGKDDRYFHVLGHDEAYVVVIMKKRDPNIFRGRAGAYWTREAMTQSHGGDWISFDEIPPFIASLLQKKSEFSEEEIERAMEFINGD